MTRREWLTAMGVSPGVLDAIRNAAAAGRSGAAEDAANRRASSGWSSRSPQQTSAPNVASAPSSDDPTLWSIAEVGAALAAGRVTPIEITGAYLRRIDEQNGALGAFVTITRDRAFDDTSRIMRASSGTWARGPLFAVPVAHKDLFRTRGVRTTAGSRLYDTLVPDDDADVVTRLSRAGAVMLGKTNTHELGGGVTTINPYFGATHNPRDLARIAGGSSGGSAAAVAARLTLLATGSDTGGSVRIPAALCGCVGFKPTFGLLPTAGLLGACPTFDHVGLLTRSAEDAALAMSAILPDGGGVGAVGSETAGGAAARMGLGGLTDAVFIDRYRAAVARGVKGLRIGVARSYFEGIEPGVRTAIERALDALRVAGARVRDESVGGGDRLYDEMFAPIAVSEIRATYAQAWRSRPEAFSKDFAAVFAGPGPTAAAVTTAREARKAFQRSMEGVLAELDVVVMPTVPQVAPRIDGPIDGMRILRNTWPFNAARVPAVTVPCGTGEGGLPVGLQLVGRMHADAGLLGIATAVTNCLSL